MIGTSLPLGLLTGSPCCEADKRLIDSYGTPGRLLAAFRERGVSCVELRSVRPNTPLSATAACAEAVLNAGLHLTIHATMTDVSARDFFSVLMPALALLPAGHPVVPLTLHSLRTGDETHDRAATIRLLRAWSDYALEHALPIRFALENNRIHESGLSIVDCYGVASTVRETTRPNVGVCFDFGHLYSNFKSYPECTPFLPPEGFLRAAVHTHIHGLADTTHCPLLAGSLPLEEYVGQLRRTGYRGIYNLELESGRFWRTIEPRTAFELSIDRLRDCLSSLEKENPA